MLVKSSAKNEAVKVGDEVSMKVVRLDPQNRKLGLSVNAYKEDSERMDLKSYMDKQNEEVLENKIPLDKSMSQFSAPEQDETDELPSEDNQEKVVEDTADQDEGE